MNGTSRRWRIPLLFKASSHKLRRLSKSFVSALDTWGCHIEPGRYFGRFLHREKYFHVYGAWVGDSVALHREDDRDGDPVAQVYFTPSRVWWIKPLVYGTAANGLIGLHENFVRFTKTHPELKNPENNRSLFRSTYSRLKTFVCRGRVSWLTDMHVAYRVTKYERAVTPLHMAASISSTTA